MRYFEPHQPQEQTQGQRAEDRRDKGRDGQGSSEAGAKEPNVRTDGPEICRTGEDEGDDPDKAERVGLL